MVALGMLPKERNFRQLKHRMETLEEQNSLLMEMVQWLVTHHGGSFPLPSGGWLHTRSSPAMGSMDKSGMRAHQVPLLMVKLLIELYGQDPGSV